MLDRLVIWFVRAQLRRVLGSYTTNLDIQLQSGTLRLNHVVLSPEALARLGLPLSVRAVTVRKLEVLLPWRKGAGLNAPFIVRLDGVRVVLCSRIEADDLGAAPTKVQSSYTSAGVGHSPEAGQREKSREWLARRKAARLHKSRGVLGEEGAVGGADNADDDAAAAPRPRLNAAQQQALIDMVLQSLVISVTNVSLRVEEGFGTDAEPGALVPPAASAADKQQAWAVAARAGRRGCAVLEARLDSLSLRCRRDSGLPGLLAMLPIPSWLPWPRRAKRSREQTAAVEIEATVSASWQASTYSAGSRQLSATGHTLATDALAGGEAPRVALIQPLALHVTLDIGLTWPTPADAAAAAAASRGPPGPHLRLSGGAELSEAIVVLPRAALCCAARLARRIAHAEAFER